MTTVSIIKTDTGGFVEHSSAWDTFLLTTEVAERLGLYGAGQDAVRSFCPYLPSSSWSGVTVARGDGAWFEPESSPFGFGFHGRSVTR